MKKLFLLFLSLAVFAACSKDDDDNGGNEPDPIIGTWVLVNASTPLDTQFCDDEESVITFNENNTGEATFYLTASECSATESEGTWSNNGNSSYTISVPVIGNLNGTANFTSADRFTFSTSIVGVPGTLTFERQ